MSFTKKLIQCIIFTCISNIQAQTISQDTVWIPEGSTISSDNLDNLFVITPTNDIIKYNKNGEKLATANFKVLGNISSIDAGNPFEIYVFYRDQNKIIFLDNMLNIRGECDLENIGISQIACIARSSDNQIWLFDMSEQKLKKYSKDLKLLNESAALNNYSIGNEINPSLILDVNSSILILNNYNVIEFDLYANFNKTVLIDTLKTFQFLNSKIVFLKDNSIKVYDKSLFKMEVFNQILPMGTKSVRIEKERLFILKDEFVILRPISK
jgi:hypothetical protein